MYKRLGYLAAGIVVGALITGYLVNNEIRSKMDEKEPETKHDLRLSTTASSQRCAVLQCVFTKWRTAASAAIM